MTVVVKHSWCTQPSTVTPFRVTIKYLETLITDSGDVYDTTIGGGRVGLLTFHQDFGIWSNLRAQCAETVNRALEFDGNDDYVDIGTLEESQLDLVERLVLFIALDKYLSMYWWIKA